MAVLLAFAILSMLGGVQLRHPYEKIMQLELLTLGASVLIGLIALIQASVFFIILSFYFIVLSLACDVFSHNYTSHRQQQGLKQAVRAGMLFFLTTVLIFLL